jgi:hypothetical protein
MESDYVCYSCGEVIGEEEFSFGCCGLEFGGTPCDRWAHDRCIGISADLLSKRELAAVLTFCPPHQVCVHLLVRKHVALVAGVRRQSTDVMPLFFPSTNNPHVRHRRTMQ